MTLSIFLLTDVPVAFDNSDHTHGGVPFMFCSPVGRVCRTIINMHLSVTGGGVGEWGWMEIKEPRLPFTSAQ